MVPDFTREDTLPGPVAGVDEVGRGPWAGPVVACAVILDRNRTPDGLRDSKKLTAKRREGLDAAIRQSAHIGIGSCIVEEIDAPGMGIGRATLLAMKRAVEALPVRPAGAVIDGNQRPDIPDLAMLALPRADAISASVAAASIVAKVYRDAIMSDLADAHPGYGWASNKGYGTAEHARGLAQRGVTAHHRRSFAPIAKLVLATSS